MLDVLLKFNNLGGKKEISFLLFQALSPGIEYKREDLTSFCAGSMFSIRQSIDGILSLLDYLSFTRIQNGKIQLNTSVFSPDKHSPEKYFESDHFFRCLFEKLLEDQAIIFDSTNIKYSSTEGYYYIISSLIKFSFFSIRNLLIGFEFLEVNELNPGVLIVSKRHTRFFQNVILNDITPYKPRKFSLEQLKEVLHRREEAGADGEWFVLDYERTRLLGHHLHEKIEIISTMSVGEGYDIVSFEGLDSIFIDRFIEVKSYVGEVSFFWSRKELETAKSLGDKYFLYLVDRNEMHNTNYSPIVFQNPYRRIFENAFWKKEVENWRISFEEALVNVSES